MRPPALPRFLPSLNRGRVWPLLAFLALLLSFALPARAEDAPVAAGSTFSTFAVGAVTYRDVKVLSINARTAMIRHAGGMASIRLRDLSPEWQARFHYDPSAEAAAEQALAAAPPPKPAPMPKPVAKKPASKFEALLLQFGKPAEIRPEVDLRRKFLDLELGVKNQGRRPSCSVFAVVSALEFQNAETTGRVEKFSEEYLIWAVRQSVQQVALPGIKTSGADDDADAGFTLSEVVNALRAYGIPLQSTMPNTFGPQMSGIHEPPKAVIEEARTHQRVFVHLVPGRDRATLVNNLVQALNNGIPVPVGMAWPNFRTIPTGYLSGQKPMPDAGHAVTIVGYRCATGRIEDTVFMFKNSWGAQWGQGGYGTVTYGYLNNYLGDAIVLEVQG